MSNKIRSHSERKITTKNVTPISINSVDSLNRKEIL